VVFFEVGSHFLWEGRTAMKGRKPRLLSLSEADRRELQRSVRRGKTEQRVARRASVLLAMENPQTVVASLAEHFDLGRTTIWELCRKYEQRGREVIYDASRSGRPRVFSPLGQGADRTTCMLRASRHRLGDDSLVHKELGQGGGQERDRAKDSPFDCFLDLENSRSPASSQSVLEDSNLG